MGTNFNNRANLNASNTNSCHRITIGLYSLQTKESYNKALFDEIEAIKTIQTKFSEAAKTNNCEPPEIVISISLVPDWENEYDYNNPIYQKLKADLLQEFKKNLGEATTIVVEDFYADPELTEQEKQYLVGLRSKGSNADMIKTHAIIRGKNHNLHHLQMDSNTKISSYSSLYQQTFGAQDNSPHDKLNASFYDPPLQYVSAHNKIVFTKPTNSAITNQLKKTHLEYCHQHRNDHQQKNSLEKIKKNSIYSKDFTEALLSLGLTGKKTINANTTYPKTIYPAVMTKPQYTMTKHILTAVNMSWKKEVEDETLECLKKLPPVEVGDVTCDYACFVSTVHKHTSYLCNHSSDPYDDTEARRQLMDISDVDFEKRLIKDFIWHVYKNHNETLRDILNVIPVNDERGKELIRDIFKAEIGTINSIDELQNLLSEIKFSLMPLQRVNGCR